MIGQIARRVRRAGLLVRARAQRRRLNSIVRSCLRPTPDRHNVLFLIPWMTVGGADRVNLDLATYLSKDMFSLHFITTDASDNPWAKRFSRVTENVCHLPDRVYPENYEAFILSYIRHAAVRTVIVSNSVLGYRATAEIRRNHPRVRILDLLHGEGGRHENGGFPKLSSHHQEDVDGHIVVTQYLKDLLVREYAFPPDRITVIRNGIDAREFAPERIERGRYRRRLHLHEGDFLLTYLGRFAREKHPEHVLKVAELLLEKVPQIPLHVAMAGDGPLALEIQQSTTNTARLADRVHFLGYVDDATHLLRDSDVVILPSEAEGLPLVALEAMSLCIPVVASAVGGLRELIGDRVDGYLLEYSENLPQEAAEIVEALAHSSEIRRAVGLGARRKVEAGFSLERMVAMYETLLLVAD